MYTGIYGKNNLNLSCNVHIKQQLVVVKFMYNYNVSALYTHYYIILCSTRSIEQRYHYL